MLRETKVGIAISCAFLGLAGTVIATKLRQQDNANIESRVQEIRPAPQSKPVAVSSGPRASSTPGTLSPDVKDKGSEVRPVVAEEKVASATGMTDTWPPPIPLTPSPDPKKKVKGTEPIDPESTVIPAPVTERTQADGGRPKEKTRTVPNAIKRPTATEAAPSPIPAVPEPIEDPNKPPAPPTSQTKAEPVELPLAAEKEKKKEASPTPEVKVTPLPVTPEPKQPVKDSTGAGPVPLPPEIETILEEKKDKKDAKKGMPTPPASEPSPIPALPVTPSPELPKKPVEKTPLPAPAEVGLKPADAPMRPLVAPMEPEKKTPAPPIVELSTPPMVIPAITPAPSPIPKESAIKVSEPPLDPMPPVVARTPELRPGPVQVFSSQDHKVRAGDTYASISKQMYHSEAYARALRQFNLDAIRVAPPVEEKDGSLKAGEEITVPDQVILEQRYPAQIKGFKQVTGAAEESSPPADRKIAPVPTSPAPVAAAPVQGPRYTVPARGQTMREIAVKTLENGDRWQEIYHLNPKLQPDYNLPAGTVLQLPPDAVLPPK
jgi:hypothetical protein